MLNLSAWNVMTAHNKKEHVSRLFYFYEDVFVVTTDAGQGSKEAKEKKIKRRLTQFRKKHTAMMVARGHVLKLYKRARDPLRFICWFI